MVVKHDGLQSCSMDQSLMGHRVLINVWCTHWLVFKNLEHFFIWWQVLVRDAILSYNTICIRKWNSFNNDLFCGCLLYGTVSRNSLWGKTLPYHPHRSDWDGGEREPQSGRAACEQAVRARMGSVSSLFISSLLHFLPSCVFMCFNRLYFLEKFYVHSKIECKVQIFPAPTYTWPTINIPHQSGILGTTDESTSTHHYPNVHSLHQVHSRRWTV